MTGQKPLSVEQQEAVIKTISQMQVPQLVFNGFANGHTASEMTSVLSFAERPVAVLVMPPSVAKSFAISLLETVNGYEAATATTIETIEVLTERITSYVAEQQK